MKKMKDNIRCGQKYDVQMLIMTVFFAILVGLCIWISIRLHPEGYRYSYCMLCDDFMWFGADEDDFCINCQWIVDAAHASE